MSRRCLIITVPETILGAPSGVRNETDNPESVLNGAEALIKTAVSAGIEICFANPGTTEMPLVHALDTVHGIRAILGLFEGVCTGAADGYARMTGRPALTLLHLGPGLANGSANLHNACRAHSPIVNLIGEHATWHVTAAPPLATDISALAAPVSAWVDTIRSAADITAQTAAAISAARRPPGGVASLIVPADCQWNEAGPSIATVKKVAPPTFKNEAVAGTTQILQSGSPTLLLLGDRALRREGLWAAARIASHTGCRLVCEAFPSRLERGAGLPALERLPYFPEEVLETIGGASHIILAGARRPVTFFAYPDQPSHPLPEGCTVHSLAAPGEDVVGALQSVAEEVGASQPDQITALSPPPKPSGHLTASSLGLAVAAVQPAGTIIVDEALTTGRHYLLESTACPPHTYLTVTGGAIGMGLPCATGAAVASPERPVISLQADGSGLYTLQALWTQARIGLDITTVICANRVYRILQLEFSRAYKQQLGPHALALTNLSQPPIDWVGVSQGLGVPAVRVERAEHLVRELERALTESGPHLIEALIGD